MNSSANDIPFDIYNIGTGKNHSILEVADMIGGKRVLIPARTAEVEETLADITKTMKDLKWEPKYNLEDKIMSY